MPRSKRTSNTQNNAAPRYKTRSRAATSGPARGDVAIPLPPKSIPSGLEQVLDDSLDSDEDSSGVTRPEQSRARPEADPLSDDIPGPDLNFSGASQRSCSSLGWGGIQYSPSLSGSMREDVLGDIQEEGPDTSQLSELSSLTGSSQELTVDLEAGSRSRFSSPLRARSLHSVLASPAMIFGDDDLEPYSDNDSLTLSPISRPQEAQVSSKPVRASPSKAGHRSSRAQSSPLVQRHSRFPPAAQAHTFSVSRKPRASTKDAHAHHSATSHTGRGRVTIISPTDEALALLNVGVLPPPGTVLFVDGLIIRVHLTSLTGTHPPEDEAHLVPRLVIACSLPCHPCFHALTENRRTGQKSPDSAARTTQAPPDPNTVTTDIQPDTIGAALGHLAGTTLVILGTGRPPPIIVLITHIEHNSVSLDTLP
ncbi:hypothetical protein VKT23_020491 [Stygiomarasmius scandens]|uniref:Uncharacterized protein n=1 Tax=Marasmiellus scandens TaxID=2682957 RepID=A0ABR1IMB8_9AGAR